MTEKIGLQATLETSQFEQGARTYNAGIDAMETANTEFAGSTDDVTTGLSAVDDATATAGQSAVELAAQMDLVTAAYDAVAAAVGEAIELADLAVQADRAEERFRAFAGEIGDADELLAAFNRGAGGTVDKLTAMTSAGRLLQMGLVQNNDEMEQVVEIATRLGDQTQSAGDRVADFALLLANQSIPRLDNFGISSGKVRARIAELQDEFKGMSREAAFSQAVFEQGAKSLDILGARTQDAGSKMEVARANIANMRVEMGQKLLPVISSLFGFVANLNTNTLMMIAVLGGGIPVILKVGTALKAMKAGMGSSVLTMGALVAAVGVLIIAVDEFNVQMDKMNAAQDGAQAAAATLGDQVQALVDDGMSLADAMTQVSEKVNTSTDAFNDNMVASSPLGALFGANAAFTDTMTTATGSLTEAILANTDSYFDYISQVDNYNAGITDSAGRLAILTEAEFNMANIRLEGASATSLLADEILKEKLAMSDAAADADLLAQRIGEVADSSERAGGPSMELVASADRMAEASARAGGAVGDLTAQLDASTAAREKVARVEDMQATSALAATAALEAKRQKDIETVQAEQALAQSVLNASDAMIAQTFITGLDPEAMGLIAYQEAVENIQLSFGLATPESIALARGITQGVDAINAGEIAREDMSEFVNAIIDDSKDATSSMGTLTREFASSGAESERLAGRIADTGEAILNNVAATEDLIAAEEGLDATTNAIGDTMVKTTGLIANVADENELWLDTISMTDRVIDDTQVTTEQWADKMQGLGNRLSAAGEETLSAGQKVDALNSVLERTDSAGSGAATGLGEVEVSAGNAALAIDEATTATGELDAALEGTAANAGVQGAAIAGNLGSALAGGMRPVIDDFKGQLQELRDALPGSEPKDTTSPLYRLDKAGKAIFENLDDGMEEGKFIVIDRMAAIGSAMGQALTDAIGANAKDLFGAAGVLGGLGGAAAGILQRETVDPLEQRIDNLIDGAEEAQEQFDDLGEQQLEIQDQLREQGDLEHLLLLFEVDRSQLTQEQISMLVQMNQIMSERQRLAQSINNIDAEILEKSKELGEQQERLNRLQQQQENLRFLEQQAALLELIAEHGLDAADILGGLELGLDANVEDIIDAMSAAMQLIIAQAEEELGIASESKVFKKIGNEAMQGMASGIEQLMGLPVAQSAIATQAMIAAPAAIVAPRNNSVDNSRSMGDVNIHGRGGAGQMSDTQLVATIKRVVDNSMRGVN